MKREHVETLRALREEYAGKPGDFSQDRAAIDAAIALAEAVERAPVRNVVGGQWDDVFAREGNVVWCSDLNPGQRVRLLPEMAAEGRE